MTTEKPPFFLFDFQYGSIIRAPEYCEPKPPSFGRAKKWKIEIEGTKLEFKIPKHNPWVKGAKAKFPEHRYHFKDLHFKDNYSKSFHLKDEWQIAHPISNTVWQFHGPFLTGMFASIDASFMILRLKETNESTSYFHPRVFENEVAKFITNGNSKQKQDGLHKYIAPVNWKAYNDFPVNAARYKVVTNESVPHSHYKATEYFIFALDDNHLAYIVFNHSRHVLNARTKADYDKRVGEKYINESVENVINSIKISLSPEAIAQQKKALKGLEDTSVTTSFPPLKWDRVNSETPDKLENNGTN